MFATVVEIKCNCSSARFQRHINLIWVFLTHGIVKFFLRGKWNIPGCKCNTFHQRKLLSVHDLLLYHKIEAKVMLPAIKNSLPTQNAIMMIMISSQLFQGLNRDHKMDCVAPWGNTFGYCFDIKLNLKKWNSIVIIDIKFHCSFSTISQIFRWL